MTTLFLDLLAGPARSAEAFYILGDLFEAWIGDDDPAPHHAQVAAGLKGLAACGVPVQFLAGNRDFLLGKDYARSADTALLDEPVHLALYGVPTLLLHGDVLCTDDTEYQAFRRTVRDSAWQRQFLARPLAERRLMAADARAESRRRGAEKAPQIMDVNQDAVRQTFRHYGIRRMIHGHTHRPAVHRFTLDGQECERVVLGDWYENGSLLRVGEQGVEIISFQDIKSLS